MPKDRYHRFCFHAEYHSDEEDEFEEEEEEDIVDVWKDRVVPAPKSVRVLVGVIYGVSVLTLVALGFALIGLGIGGGAHLCPCPPDTDSDGSEDSGDDDWNNLTETDSVSANLYLLLGEKSLSLNLRESEGKFAANHQSGHDTQMNQAIALLYDRFLSILKLSFGSFSSSPFVKSDITETDHSFASDYVLLNLSVECQTQIARQSKKLLSSIEEMELNFLDLPFSMEGHRRLTTMKSHLSSVVREFELNLFLLPIRGNSGPHLLGLPPLHPPTTLSYQQSFRSLPIKSRIDQEEYLNYLNSLSEYLGFYQPLLERGITENVVLSCEETKIISERFSKITTSLADDLLLFLPLSRASSEIQQRGRELIEKEYITEIMGLQDFWDSKYAPLCRNTLGAHSFPRRSEVIDYFFGSFDLRLLGKKDKGGIEKQNEKIGDRNDPNRPGEEDQLFDVACEEMKKIEGEMNEIAMKEGFSSWRKYSESLDAKDKINGEQWDAMKVMMKTRVEMSDIRGKMPSLFLTLDRCPLQVLNSHPLLPSLDKEVIPSILSPSSPFYLPTDQFCLTPAVYTPPSFSSPPFFSSYLPTRQFKSQVLRDTYPGLHYRTSFLSEFSNDDSLFFQDKFSFTTQQILSLWKRGKGEVQGIASSWGLYAEGLGQTRILNVFADLESKFGFLERQRQAVCWMGLDLGVHVFKWTFEQALDHYRLLGCSTFKESEERRNEELEKREIMWVVENPGQGVLPKYGEMFLRHLQSEVVEQGGSDIDSLRLFLIREFHNVVLSCGEAPLSTISRFVQQSFLGEERNTL